MPIDELIRRADERKRHAQSALEEGTRAAAGPSAGRPAPPKLARSSMQLWRSFCTADARGVGTLDRQALFSALKQAGALEGPKARVGAS